MPDPNAIFDALDTEYQRREAEAGAFPADLAEIAKTTPYVAEKLARQRGWSPTAAVDPEAFAYETAERLLKEAPDTPDEDVLAIKAWAERRKGVNVVREETAAKAGQDMTSAAGSAFNATAVPLASEASRATFGIPEFVARKVVAPVVEAVTGANPATKDQVQAAQAQGREAHPFLSDLSGGVGATAGAMTLMVPAAGAMTPVLAKVGMSPGVASTVANLLAGAAHGGAVEGSAEGALRSGLFMGGQSALGRVFRGATPGAARYVASEAAAGSTASVLAQLATEGHADPARVLADGVVNALFGIGGARAASRAKAREHVAAEVAKGREIPEIVSDDVFKAMWEESRNYPDPMVEAASTRGEFDARLAEMQASKAEIPAIDPVAEAKATAAEFDARPTPEPTAPEKPVSVAPVAPDAPASKTLVGMDNRGREVWDIRGRYYVKDGQGRYGAAHPQEVAEAKASAQGAAIEPRVEAPTAEVVKRPSALDALERAGYPGAKEAREALDAIPDSTTRWDPVRKEWTRDPVDFTEVEARPMEAAPAEAPAPRPGKQAERGALSLAPVGELVTDVARGVKRAFGSFISRVEALDTPAAKEAAAKAKVAADQTRAFRGEMGRELLAVEKLTGQPIVTEHGRAATTLATPEFVPGKTYAVSPLYDAMEGRSVPADPAQARIIKAGQALVSKRGELFQREGFQQYDAQTDTWAPFQNRGGEIAPRIMTPEFSEIIQAGPRSKAWRPTIEAFADLNNVPVPEVEAYFNSRHKEANGEGPEGASKRAQAEFKRGFDRVPVVVRVGGENFRLFETNPATYFRRLAEAGASRLGVVKAFGQDTGTQNPVSDLRERFRTETGKPEDFVALQRLLHGQSKDRPIVDPSSATGGLVRNLGRAWTGLKELLLSGSAVTNIPESLGSTRDVTGSLGLARAIFRAFRGSKDPINATVEALGYKTTDAINTSYDPANPRESTIRAFTELMSRGTLRKFVEEIQERVAAIGGKEWVDGLAAGKGKERDVQRLLVLGKSQAEARRLAAGQGTQAEYDAVGRSVPSSTVGANLSRAERSWVENTRALKPINAIASYAHNTIRNAAMQGKAFLSTMGTLTDPSLTNAQRAQRAFAATRHLTGFVVGKSLQGAMQYFLMSSLIGGKTGASIAASEAEDDPVKFALTSFIMATVGGPYAAAGRAMFGDGDISAISPQLSVALQFKDALAGEGRYRDLPIEERMKAIGERVLPASKYIRGIAVATGLASEESRNIDISRAAYWRWRREFDKPVNWGADLKDDNGYRTALKSAYLDMTRGGDPEVVSKRVLAAIGGEDAIGKDKKKAAESIRRRMLLTAPAVKGKLDALKSRIGDKAYKTLEAHDALLESLADSVQRGG